MIRDREPVGGTTRQIFMRSLCTLMLGLFLIAPYAAAEDPVAKKSVAPIPGNVTEAPRPSLILLTEENPPYNFTNPDTGEIDGIAVTIVQELMTRAGVDYSLALMPWQRAYRRAKEVASTCVFVTNRTPEREEKFKWVGPLIEGGWAIFKRPDSDIILHDVSGLKNYVVAGKRDGGAIEPIEHASGIRIVTTSSDETAARMLYHGRADLWVSGVTDAPMAARAIGAELPKLALLWKKADLSLACAKNTPEAVLTRLREINTSLDAFREQAIATHTRVLLE